MRTSKKLFSVAVAIVMGLGISLPTSVAASNESLDTVSYDPCDVNHDGSVDIMDVIRLNKYLGGMEAVLHTDYLDANGNKTNSNMLIYTNHDWNGLSGSPVYTATKYKVGNNNWVSVYTALAVNTRKYTGGNGGLGPAFNEFLLTFYRQGSTNVGY